MKYKKYWRQLIDVYGSTCVYCNVRAATSIDHIIPYSYYIDNEIENLVPSCMVCNGLAGNKVFNTFEQKRQYVRNKLKNKKTKIFECVDCLLPYQYRIASPSPLLCPECYDKEYGTRERNRKSWIDWLLLLKQAEYNIRIHRQFCVKYSGYQYDRKSKHKLLADLILINYCE